MNSFKKNYEKELPEGYIPIFEFDAKNKKTSLLMTLFSFLLTIVLIIPVFCLSDFKILLSSIEERSSGNIILLYVIWILSMIAYLILHELVHGLFYKIFTRQKLTFGITLTVAFCGVPDIFVYRKAALWTTLAPFIVFTAIMTPLNVLLYKTNPLAFILYGILEAIHIGGCSGDLIVSWNLIFKFRDNSLLVKDTGPKQTFYLLQKN